ncbi:MAG: sugar ABC transporter permease [Oscillospiraceae bacterium]|jgi:raffinose/stachyose/melibiose transport system permease protein|nr:sugar ABC transporter permease [Oscillospiraceae bacterium]
MLSAQKRDIRKLILLFFLPAVLIWLTAMVIPFFYGIWISFVKWDGIGDNYTFVALENFTKIFSTTKFMQSLSRTAIYTVGTVLLSNLLGMALGLLLTSALKGRNVFRTAIFVPNVIGGIAMGYIWRYLFHYGLTAVGKNLGLAYLSTSMLSDPTKAMIALIIVSSWQLSAYLMILYVAGFTNVPNELVEAARVDGASPWMMLRKVRLPMIRPSITICLFLAIVRSFMVFEVNLSLTDGGPFGSTELIAYRIYNTAFVSLKFGNAQAQAVVLFLVVALVSVLQAYFTSRREVEL